MEENYYIIKAVKPSAHYIISLTDDDYISITKFLLKLKNPEYAMGHKGTTFEIITPAYKTIEEAEEALSNILF